MLALTFWIGPLRFAIDSARVLQVVPRVELRGLPGFEQEVAGLLDLGTAIVPVVDLGMRLRGQACPARLSTRIVVVRLMHEGKPAELGLIAEWVTDLLTLDEDGQRVLAAAPASQDGLGAVLRIGGELVQWIDVDTVVSSGLRARLYRGILAPPS